MDPIRPSPGSREPNSSKFVALLLLGTSVQNVADRFRFLASFNLATIHFISTVGPTDTRW